MNKQEITPIVFDKTNTKESVIHYKKHGYVVIQVLDKNKCDEMICEQWEKVILKQPWTEKYPLNVKASLKNQSEFAAEVTGPLTKTQLKNFETGWTFHRGFGACCDPQVFHLPLVWNLRQDEDLYKIASELCGTSDLWCDINRSIQKLPGQGEHEFLHWDLDPFFRAKNPKKTSNVCGKVCYSDSRFICVPGTHTTKFLKKFSAAYSDIYPPKKKPVSKLGLNTEKSDPLKLISKRKKIKIPTGCAIFWDDQLLHGVEKIAKTENVEYGCYLGYFPAGSRPEYKRKSKVDELQDRIDSFNEGRAPILWPSFDKISYYPKKFQNFPKILKSYLDKIPEESPHRSTRINGKGKIVPDIIPVIDENYKPPILTDLGKKLLGLSQL